MARRTKSDEWIDLVFPLAGVLALLTLFSPGIRNFLSAVSHLFLWLGAIAVAGAFCVAIFFVARRTFGTKEGDTTTESEASAPEDVEESDPPTAVTAVSRSQPIQIQEKLRKIDWFQFEQIIGIVYRKSGFTVERKGGANPDGGIDLIITSAVGEPAAVQCKHWKSWKVGVKVVREFFGAMSIAGIKKGIIVTTQGYTAEANGLAQKQGIQLLDEVDVLRLLEQVDAKYDPEILELLNDTRKLCPKCEHALVLRTATKGKNAGEKFLGCSNFPRCRFTMPLG